MKFSEILLTRLNRPENKGDDFGYTSQVNQNSKRVINKDGSFNLVRVGEKTSLYHTLVTMPWWFFLPLIVSTYIVVNMFFAGIYLLSGMLNFNCLIISGKTAQPYLFLIRLMIMNW